MGIWGSKSKSKSNTRYELSEEVGDSLPAIVMEPEKVRICSLVLISSLGQQMPCTREDNSGDYTSKLKRKQHNCLAKEDRRLVNWRVVEERIEKVHCWMSLHSPLTFAFITPFPLSSIRSQIHSPIYLALHLTDLCGN